MSFALGLLLLWAAPAGARPTRSFALDLEAASARAAALGQSLAAPSGQDAFTGNPAAPAAGPDLALRASQQSLWQGLSRSNLEAVLRPGGLGAFSLGAAWLDYGSFESYDGQGRRGDDFRVQRLALRTGLARGLAPGLDAGLDLRWSRLDREREGWEQWNGSAGLAWRPWKGWGLGAVLGGLGQALPQARAGLGWAPSLAGPFEWGLSLESVFSSTGAEEWRGGLELGWRRRLWVRGGWRQAAATDEASPEPWSAGLGLALDQVRFDYAFQASSGLGPAHHASLAWHWERPGAAGPPDPSPGPAPTAQPSPATPSPTPTPAPPEAGPRPLSPAASSDSLKVYFGFTPDSMEQARQYEDSGLYEAAQRIYQDRLSREPADARAAAALGRVFLLLGQPALARSQLERALELDPAHPEAKRLLRSLTPTP